MKVLIRHINDPSAEQVVIECTETTPDVEDIRDYALTKGTTLYGQAGERMHRFRLEDVFYFEAVDKRVFAYTEEAVYEVKTRLYQLETAYADRLFRRSSKSTLLNLLQLESIAPALNSRFTARLKNGEQLILSRQYAPAILNAVMRGEQP